MEINAAYDSEADALYVQLRAGERHHTVELSDVVYVDVDADDNALGVELLYPSLGLDLSLPARRFGLEADLPRILSAIQAAGAPGVSATMTGGQVYSSSVTLLVAAEGTVAADRGLIPAPTQTLPDQILATA